MNLQNLKKKKIPNTPGVYFFKRRKKILYIGKATSLSGRVRSYLTKDIEFVRSPWIAKMVLEAKNVSFQKTDSVLEALFLEAELIKKYQPPYNTEQKDDKSYNHVIITKEEYPQVLLARERDLQAKIYKLKADFGPFPKAGSLKEALKIIRRIFPYRDNKCLPNSATPCFNCQIGLCPGVCIGAITQKEYGKIIRNIINLFKGKKKTILQDLKREMKAAIKAQEFETAGAINRKIKALDHINDMTLIKNDSFRVESAYSQRSFRVEAYDVAHISGKEMVGVMVVIENNAPNKSEYRKFNIKSVIGANDPASLKEILTRRFNHSEWKNPNLIVVDGNVIQEGVAKMILKERSLEIPVVAVTKNEKHRPKSFIGDGHLIKRYKSNILLANSEAHRFAIKFHKEKRAATFLS